MKLHKQILVTFISALLTLVVAYGGFTLYAATDAGVKEKLCGITKDIPLLGPWVFDDNKVIGFKCVKAVYHEQMNNLFNDKIKKLVTILKKTDFSGNPDFQSPPIKGVEDLGKFNIDVQKLKNQEPQDFEAVCPAGNVSTFCLSLEALKRYIAYVDTLEAIRKKVVTPAEYAADASGNPYAGFWPVLTMQMQDRDKAIDDEIKNARRIMEATLAAYDEFKTAYPMHKRYEVIVKDLVQYKQKLKSLRHSIELLPGKFIDATSKSCQ